MQQENLQQQSFALSSSLLNELRNFARFKGVAFDLLLLVAFKTLLVRYTAQDTIVTDISVNEISPKEAELHLDFVPRFTVRADFSSDPSFLELLDQIHHTFQLEELGRTSMTDLPHSSLWLRSENGPLTWWLRIEETTEGVAVWLAQNEPATMARMVGHYQTLLAELVQNPAERISRVSLLSATERQQVLEEWNATTRTYPRERSLWEVLQTQAEQTPEAVALVCGGDTLTYRALVAQARGVATRLRAAGAGPEVLVGVCLERSLDWVVSLVGIVAAGGAYVPLDPQYPKERLTYLVHDLIQAQGGRPPLVVTTPDLANRLPAEVVDVLNVATGFTSPPATMAEAPSRPTADNLAYVMYTSGSTGQPKGSAVTHRNVVRLVKEQAYARLGPDETFLHVAPIAFDASTFEIWGSLLNGSRLVILPGSAPTLAELGTVLEQEQISVLWLTAGLFHQMVDEQLASLGGVRQLLAGGDVLSPGHVQRVLEAHPEAHVINGYGPTECTTFTCCYQMQALEQVGQTVSIGRPIANTQVFILDAHLHPVPIGVPGELYIGGDGVSRGYVNRPDLTAQAFVPHPFGGAGARLYKTGDLVRYRADGRIEFLGRRDQQVKLRGFRIELGEIEAVLQQHPAIQQAVVVATRVARAGLTDDKRLIAYLLQDEAQPLTTAELRAWLKERVPDYLVPAAFVTLAAFPLTANGKIDRQALPAPDYTELGASEVFVAPSSVAEMAITKIWCDALGIEKIGIHDNFFALGGHSLIATRVLSRLRDAFQIDLPLRSLFDSPTVAGLATAVEDILIADIDTLTNDEAQQQVGL
jgi:amino acid adenylation domain-containing protein